MSGEDAQEESLDLEKYLQAIKRAIKGMKQFDYKSLFQDVLTFISIIVAYLVISLTYRYPAFLKNILQIDLTHHSTLYQLLATFSFFLIFWKIVAKHLKNRALQPPPKNEQYEEIPIEETPEVPVVLKPLPNGQLYAHQLIDRSLETTTYIFLLQLTVAAYAYKNQPILPSILSPSIDALGITSVQKLNYLCVWLMIAVWSYMFGCLAAKISRMEEFKVFGIAMMGMVGILSLGLAQQFNTFLFI